MTSSVLTALWRTRLSVQNRYGSEGRMARTQIMQCPGDEKISNAVVGPLGTSREPLEIV